MTGSKPHSIETHLIVKGVVQGVFFRAKTKKHADALGLKGYVKNLPDGSVEICVSGQSIEALIAKLEAEPLPVHIEEITTLTKKPSQEYKDFSIKY